MVRIRFTLRTDTLSLSLCVWKFEISTPKTGGVATRVFQVVLNLRVGPGHFGRRCHEFSVQRNLRNAFVKSWALKPKKSCCLK